MSFTVVRELLYSDSKKVTNLIQELWKVFPQYIWLTHWNQKSIRSELNVGKGIGLWQEQELVSFILYREIVDVLEISLLATSSSALRQGSMTYLFKYFLISRGDRRIWLELSEKNIAALQFYLKFGFIEVGQRPHYYEDKSKALLLEL